MPGTAIRSAIVRNGHGIHCRPSAAIVRQAQTFPDHAFLVEAESGDTDLRSVIGLIGLGLMCDTTIKITVTGADADAVADEFVRLFEYHFDFPPRDEAVTPLIKSENGL